MKNLYGSFAAKLIAVILLCVLALSFVGCVAAGVMLLNWNAYSNSLDSFRTLMVGSRAESLTRSFGFSYRDSGGTSTNSEANLRISVENADGDVLWSDYEGEDTLWQSALRLEPDYSVEYEEDNTASYYTVDGGYDVPYAEEEAFVTPTPQPTQQPKPQQSGEPAAESGPVWHVRDYSTGERYSFSSSEALEDWVAKHSLIVKGYVPREMTHEGRLWQIRELSDLLYGWRYAILWVAGLSFLAGLLIFIFLLRAAGHRKGSEKIVPSFVDKIPFDVFTVLVIAAIGVFLTPVMADFEWPEVLLAAIPCFLLIGLSFLLWCMSFAVRVKLGTLWSGCLLVRIVRWLWRGFTALIRRLPLLWKWVLGIGAAALVDLFFRNAAVFSHNRTTFFWFLFWLLAGAATLYAVLAFRRLRLGAKEIAAGKLSGKVEEKNLILDFKDHANDLNHIRDGLNAAVEERLKSERFRTELITNVSHDIKTPLTSIINYVDLLQKEQPESETQREYLEVLARQAAKLKKLTEDLIEASKASTGALPVSREKLELGVLLDQTAGEYAEKLNSAELTPVVTKPVEPVYVLADGRQLWRVFDNLMNNVVKYALPGTRVYISLAHGDGKASVTFRNISREALNISVEELTERFVRGDSSRSTEGSGLGLSIAMSLTKLQNGEMTLAVDGDLFKVTLSFPELLDAAPLTVTQT